MIVNYRFEQYSHEKKKYEQHRECCFEEFFVRGWQLGFRRAKRRMIPRKSENVSKKDDGWKKLEYVSKKRLGDKFELFWRHI